MPAPTRLSWKREYAGDGTPVTVNLADIPDGAWMIAVFTVGGANTLDGGIPAGWRNLLPVGVQQASGTRRVSYFARIKQPGDTVVSMNIVGTGAAKCLNVMWGEGAAPVEDWLVGLVGVRNAGDAVSGQSMQAGTPSTSVAPPATVTDDDSLVISVMMEATLAAGEFTVTDGAQHWFSTTETAGVIEQLAVGHTAPAPGATAPVTATTTATSANNGQGVQIVIPAPARLSTTGNIGMHFASRPESMALTVGVDRIGGSEVVAVLSSADVEVSRQQISIDAASGWGHARFTNLTPGTHYTVRFEVDGVEQDDAVVSTATLPTPGHPTDFTVVAGSCQFTGSNHPVFDRIRDDNPAVLVHMGDLHYEDATTLTAWRSGVDQSMTAPRMKQLLEHVPMTWTWDNHDRIITDPTPAGNGALNNGATDPATNTQWRLLTGNEGWASPDTVGHTWVIGRVRFIQTDNWTAKTDPDQAGTGTFLGASQKQWFKDTLAAATEPIIVWLCQWTQATAASGRWNSYNAETTELATWINARPELKARMLMVGGDSHSVQVTDGTRMAGNFQGIPSLNVSGFNRSSDRGHGGGGWLFDAPLRTSGQLEADWGGYSRITVTDDGDRLELRWEAVRVNAAGESDVMTSFTRTVTAPTPHSVFLGSVPVQVRLGDTSVTLR